MGTGIDILIDMNEFCGYLSRYTPKKARIDAAGALHHIIVHGIERRKIFFDDADRDSFGKRLGQVLNGGIGGTFLRN